MRDYLSIFLLSGIFTSIFWFFGLLNMGVIQVTAPLPDFLILQNNKQATLLDLWFPFFETTSADGGQVLGEETDVSDLTAKSILMYDLSTNKTIYERNAKERMPMASVTKIMTAVIVLESDKTDEYVVKMSDLVGENTMGLTAGEVLTRDELLYGLLLPSGNDASEVLASNYPDGGRDGFLKAMNDKAVALGLSDTRFSNPSGLQGDGEQYTTAYDQLVITRYALENFPEFAEAVSTVSHEIPANDYHKAFSLANETNLLATYPGVRGVKTGYTPEAGYCLVSYLEYKGHKIIGVLLNSESRRSEMKLLLDYSLRSLGVDPPEYAGG